MLFNITPGPANTEQGKTRILISHQYQEIKDTFYCHDGTIISSRFICDGISNCEKGGDEHTEICEKYSFDLCRANITKLNMPLANIVCPEFELVPERNNPHQHQDY